MASFWSDYFKNKVLDHIRGVATYTPPASSYYALMTEAPTTIGGGTEVTAVSRLAVANSSAQWDAAASGLTTNKNELEFTASAPADLGEIVGIAEYDASSAGNLLTYGDLSAPKTVLAGMAFSVLAGNGQFTYTDDTV